MLLFCPIFQSFSLAWADDPQAVSGDLAIFPMRRSVSYGRSMRSHCFPRPVRSFPIVFCLFTRSLLLDIFSSAAVYSYMGIAETYRTLGKAAKTRDAVLGTSRKPNQEHRERNDHTAFRSIPIATLVIPATFRLLKNWPIRLRFPSESHQNPTPVQAARSNFRTLRGGFRKLLIWNTSCP